MGQNQIGDQGALAIAEMLAANKFLTKLKQVVDFFEISVIFNRLNSHFYLKIKSLSDNGITTDGGAAIAEAMETNRALQELK